MTYFITTISKLIQCGKCTGWIYTAHLNGWQRKVDPNPLDLKSELEARVANRKIYQTRQIGVEFELENRTLWQIENPEPWIKVLAEHSCQTPTIFEPAPLYEPFKSKEPNF
jgi:hypothetical protein